MIPQRMRAAMLVETRKIEMREIPVPVPGPGEALIRVVRASVCNGSDAALYTGRRKRSVAYPWMTLPWILGHECAGEIVALGPGATGFHVGQRVASLRYGAAFAEYQLVNIQRDALFPLPDWLTYDEGTFIEPMFAIAIYMPYIERPDNVVLMGLGPSGIMFLEQCRALGVSGLICADRHEVRLDIARKLGAPTTVNTTREDLGAVVKREFGEADVFIDATGWDVYDIGVRLLRPDGKLIAYGVPDSGVHYDGTLAFFKGVHFLIRPYDFKTPPVLGPTFERMRRLVDERKMDFRTHVTHRLPLEQTEEAVRLAADAPEKCLGIVIEVA